MSLRACVAGVTRGMVDLMNCACVAGIHYTIQCMYNFIGSHFMPSMPMLLCLYILHRGIAPKVLFINIVLCLKSLVLWILNCCYQFLILHQLVVAIINTTSTEIGWIREAYVGHVTLMPSAWKSIHITHTVLLLPRVQRESGVQFLCLFSCSSKIACREEPTKDLNHEETIFTNLFLAQTDAQLYKITLCGQFDDS